MKKSALVTVRMFPNDKFSWDECDGNMDAWFLVQGVEGTVGTHDHYGKLSSAPLKPPVLGNAMDVSGQPIGPGGFWR